MNTYMDLNAFHKDVEDALAGVAKKYGVSISGGNITYGSNELTMKIIATRTDKDVQKEEFLDNIRYAFKAFTPDDYLKIFTIKGTEYQLCGFRPRTKYSVTGKRVKDGKEFGFTYDAVKAAFGR